jgi:hypothetical protein
MPKVSAESPRSEKPFSMTSTRTTRAPMKKPTTQRSPGRRPIPARCSRQASPRPCRGARTRSGSAAASCSSPWCEAASNRRRRHDERGRDEHGHHKDDDRPRAVRARHPCSPARGGSMSISEESRQPKCRPKRNPTNGSTAGVDFASLRRPCWSSSPSWPRPPRGLRGPRRAVARCRAQDRDLGPAAGDEPRPGEQPGAASPWTRPRRP